MLVSRVLGSSLLIATTVLLGALSPGRAADTTSPGTPQEANGAPVPDLEALQAEVRSIELAFAASVRSRDRTAFSRFLDQEAVFDGGGSILRGREEILEAWEPFFHQDGPRLEWQPERILVHPQAGLALSSGPYRLTHTDAETGEDRTGTGRFFSVWRRHQDGSWAILFDSGTQPTYE